MSLLSMDQVNALSAGEFEATFGPVYEKSPWVAESAAACRPFKDIPKLLETMRQCVIEAGHEAQLALLRAHPDLAGRLAAQGGLTEESTREQRGSGLLDLDSAIMAKFRQFNEQYTQRFGFPFIICARLNSVDTILAAFERRLPNDRETEFQTALGEVAKIAELRVRDLLEDKDL